MVIDPQQLLRLRAPLFGHIRTPFRYGTEIGENKKPQRVYEQNILRPEVSVSGQLAIFPDHRAVGSNISLRCVSQQFDLNDGGLLLLLLLH